MIELKQLNQFYGQSHTLWDLNIEIKKAKCICLMEEMEWVKPL